MTIEHKSEESNPDENCIQHEKTTLPSSDGRINGLAAYGVFGERQAEVGKDIEQSAARQISNQEQRAFGKNTVIWNTDAQGRTTQAEGTLRQTFSKLKRSTAEVAEQKAAAARGRPGDVGGHIVGHRFVGDQGKINLFPQEMQFNNSAFKTMENEIADAIKSGKEVNFSYELIPPGANRPEIVRVRYRIIDPATGKQVVYRAAKFENQAGQKFSRIKF
ncbi:MAG TPA: DNA/RNA non-specific endonuclease [Terriglobia bacterium]|nr:DNA/RNA non-specific endonuclease [Terriglobia bacterium]